MYHKYGTISTSQLNMHTHSYFSSYRTRWKNHPSMSKGAVLYPQLTTLCYAPF